LKKYSDAIYIEFIEQTPGSGLPFKTAPEGVRMWFPDCKEREREREREKERKRKRERERKRERKRERERGNNKQ